MKKLLFLLLVLIIAGHNAVFASIIERVPIGDLYYNLDTEKLTASVTNEEPYSWSNYQTLQSLIIPSSVIYNTVEYNVNTIEDGSFWGSINLTSIYIPSSITKIGWQLFPDCNKLTSIVVDSENPIYDSRDNCNAIIETTTNTLIAGCKSTVIPNTVSEIGPFSFYWCKNLTSITIPNSVKTLGTAAFENCTSLVEIYIPSSVTNISDDAFDYCTALNSIVVDPENTTYDSRNNCNAVIKTETNTLWAGCKSTIIPNNVVSISWGAFYGCQGLEEISIPNNVHSIYAAAFNYCTGLTSVNISNNSTYIGNYAFGGCSNLTAITIPLDNESIEEGAWGDCPNVTSLTIPEKVNSIGNYAFHSCIGLKSITCEATTPPTLGEDVFWGVDKSISLFVPQSSIEAYKAADQWKDFTSIQAIPSTNPTTCIISYTDNEDDLIYSENIKLHLPEPPVFAGFSFVKWTAYSDNIKEGIMIQAIYKADVPTNVPEVVSNPSNRAQKLIRNGNIYILTDDSRTYTLTGQRIK